MLSIQAFIRKGARDSVVSGLLFSNPGYIQCSIVQVNKAFYILHRTSLMDFDFTNSVLGSNYSKIETHCPILDDILF